MVKYFKLYCAQEEIARLNIKICCLWTSIYDETQNIEQVVLSLKKTNPSLYRDVQLRWKQCQGVNRQLLQQLDQIKHLSGFTGQHRFVGVRQGRQDTAGPPILIPLGESAMNIISNKDDVVVNDKEFKGDVERLNKFVQSIVK